MNTMIHAIAADAGEQAYSQEWRRLTQDGMGRSEAHEKANGAYFVAYNDKYNELVRLRESLAPACAEGRLI